MDVHFHVGWSACRATSGERFSFEPRAVARDSPTGLEYDSYVAPRMLSRVGYKLLRYLLGVPLHLRGTPLDEALQAATLEHVRGSSSVDRVVALAFDQYHADDGQPRGPAPSSPEPGSDLYVSNTFVHRLCRSKPDHFLFGASIHPYRTFGATTAVDMLNEVAAAGAVLVKWLPLVQNIRADDERTVAFLRRAGELRMAMLIHYGGEKALRVRHPDQADPDPLFATLRRLRAEGKMPPVIIAHFATPSMWPVGRFNYFAKTARMLLGEFADAPVYCDTSAMGLFTRARWLKRLVNRPELHSKLVHGSDFPIPVNPIFFVRQAGRDVPRLRRTRSWVEQDYQLKTAVGLDCAVMTRGWEILRAGVIHRLGLGPERR